MLIALKKNTTLSLALTWFILITVILVRPLGLSLKQSTVLGSLFLVIVWWGTGIVHKNVASIFLIGMFLIFGDTPIEKVLYFPLSNNIILVIASYLLSQGIVNSGIADRLANKLLMETCKTSRHLVYMSFLLGILFIFIIPQPFPRVILLSSIYINLLKKTDISDEEKKIILFSVFVAASVTSLMFLNGDIIINNAIQGFGDVTFTYLEWIRLMTLPTLVVAGLIMFFYAKMFGRVLTATFQWDKETSVKPLSGVEIKAALIAALVVVLWLTESIHGISSSKIALVGVLLMFVTNLIRFEDHTAINISLLIFLTAEFAIGKVLVGSGIASRLGDFLTRFLPMSDSGWFFPVIVLIIMGLHMIMGSLITALSVLIPTLIALTSGTASSELIVLLTATSVCFHYMLPFHHVTIMLGYGNDYFDNRHVLKFGMILTGLTLLSVLFVYIPWWGLMNML